MTFLAVVVVTPMLQSGSNTHDLVHVITRVIDVRSHERMCHSAAAHRFTVEKEVSGPGSRATGAGRGPSEDLHDARAV